MSQRTGTFDVVAEVNLTTVNRIMATIHQHPDSQANLPHFFHHLATRIGDKPSPGLPSPRGTVMAQLSVPSIDVSGANTQEVKVVCPFRASFAADQGSDPFPEFIHGSLEATYALNTVSSNGQPFLQATLVNPDTEINFTPAPNSGLSNQQVQQVTQQLRQILKNNILSAAQPLPDGYDSLQFRGLSDPLGNEALAVPISLAGGSPAPGNLNSITQVFTENSAFALAISKECLEQLFKPALQEIQNFTVKFKITSPGVTWATYTVSVTSATITWMPGKIVLTVTGQATTKAWFFPNYSFEVTQAIQLKLNPTTQTFSLAPAGDPVIGGGLPASAESSLKSQVIQMRAGMLADPQNQIQDTLAGRKEKLVDLLRKVDTAGDVLYTSVALDSDGVLIKGDVQLSARLAPYVDFKLMPDGKGYTAFECWIPGGTIDKYTWTYYYKDYLANSWQGAPTETYEDTERFLFLLPPPPEPDLPFYPDGVCLFIWGTVVDPDTGDSNIVEAGQYCNWSNSLPPIPSLQEPPLPHVIWLAKNMPDPPPREAFFPDAGLRAHVNVAAGGDVWQHEKINAIVQFVSDEAELESLGSLAGVVRRALPPAIGVSVVMVFRQGLLTRIGPSIIPRTQRLGADLGAIPLMVTEDCQASWSRTLVLPEGSATFLINSEGKVAWQHRGPLNTDKLMDALPKYLTPSDGPSEYLPSLSVKVGDVAPDFLLQGSQGEWLALSKFRGHRVLLNFFQSWSAPCLVELRRLQSLYDRSAAGDSPVVFAIQGDNDPEGAAHVREQLGLKFPLLPDRNGAVAQRYGVRCWPTTVSINQQGCLSRMDRGIVLPQRNHGHRSA